VLLELPQASTACHVLVSVNVPGQVPDVVTSLITCIVVVLHPSLAVGAVKFGEVGQSIVASAP
jgi:hypothetical protein